VNGPTATAPAMTPAVGRRAWRLLTCLVLAVLVGLGLARFALTDAGKPEGALNASARPGVDATHIPGSQTAIARLQAQLRELPDEPRLLTRLGLAHLAVARETADPTQYARAEEALTRSNRLAPGQAGTLTGLGALALARHDFSQALTLAEQALEAAPEANDALAVLADAEVELGRYDAATATVQALVDRKPSLASLSRVSYLRELYGDHDGAVTTMEQAATAGTDAPGERAAVRTLLGDLHLAAADLPKAEAAYTLALREAAGPFPQAEVGLARVAAARGDLAGAAARLREVTARRPEAGSVALLGDIEAALGRPAEAARQYGLVRAIEALNRANGVAVDLELARFEADHARDQGQDPAGAVALARAAERARPTVYGADTLGWALRQAGKPAEALPHAVAATRLGTLDALLWYHRAEIEADLGRDAEAREHLATALGLNPHLTVRDLPAARRLAARLGVRVAGAAP
jgi:tetratricopeptide (TPR) repeat protein